MTPPSTFDQGAFVRSVLDPGLPPPAGLKAAPELSLAKRFNVYRNNLTTRLTGALKARFPVCLRLVGADFFEMMAQRYVHSSSPHAPRLFDYGEEFADFVSHFTPARDLPYLPDIVRLEYAVGCAYHAKDATALSWDALRTLPLERLEAATASFHPSTQIIPSRYPIVSIWRENIAPGPPRILTLDREEEALVIRPRLDVEVLALPAGGSIFVETLMHGKNIGEAANAATSHSKEFDLTASFHALLTGEAFVAINVEH